MLCRSLYDHTRLVRIPCDTISHHAWKLVVCKSCPGIHLPWILRFFHMRNLWWSLFFNNILYVCKNKKYKQKILHFFLVCTHILYIHILYPHNSPRPTFCHFVFTVFKTSIDINKTGVSLNGVSLNGGTPNLHPKMFIFGRKTNSCWVPPFYTWNLFVLYFWASTLQNNVFSNQNRGHLGSMGIPNCGPDIRLWIFGLREWSRRKLLWFWTHWKTPPRKWTNVPFLKGSCQKEIWSSNHWFSGDVLVFRGESYSYGFWTQLSSVLFLVKWWHFNCTHPPETYIPHLFSPKTFRHTMKKCLKSNPNSDHLGQFWRESYGGFLKMVGFFPTPNWFSYLKSAHFGVWRWGGKPTIEGETSIWKPPQAKPMIFTTTPKNTTIWFRPQEVASSKEVSEGFGVALGASVGNKVDGSEV